MKAGAENIRRSLQSHAWPGAAGAVVCGSVRRQLGARECIERMAGASPGGAVVWAVRRTARHGGMTGGGGGIDSDRQQAILTPSGRPMGVQNAGAFCRTEGFSSGIPLRVMKKGTLRAPFSMTGGGGGIRTHEGLLTLAGFQDRCIQPLCHPSGGGIVAAAPRRFNRIRLFLGGTRAFWLISMTRDQMMMDMNQGPFRQRDALPPGAGGGPGPLANLLGAVAGVVLFVLAVITGGFLLLIFLAAAIAMATVIGVRIWWWRRKLERDLRDRSDGERPRGTADRADAQTIDGEFTVISDDADEQRK